MKKVKYKFVWNRKNKLNKDDKALVQLRLTKGKNQKFSSTGIFLRESQWDPVEQKVKRHPNKIQLNQDLSDLVNKLEKEEYSLLAQDRELDINKIDEILNDIPEGDFIAFMERQIGNSTRTYNTIRNYNSCLSYLKKYGSIKMLADLTFENIEAFDNFLKRSGIKQSTIHKQHKVLNMFIRRAIDKDMLKLDKNPYNKFKVDSPKYTDRRYLTKEELERIEKKELPVERLSKVRDLFIFSCYTGMGYTDLANFTKNNISQGEGIEWITFTRVKTSIPTNIPIFPPVKRILEKYNYILPVITNQKLNAYLKEIQVLCEIDQSLEFYMARHTFATTVTLSNDVPLESVKEMLGHTNIKTTQIYAKILKSKIQRDTEALMDKLK